MSERVEGGPTATTPASRRRYSWRRTAGRTLSSTRGGFWRPVVTTPRGAFWNTAARKPSAEAAPEDHRILGHLLLKAAEVAKTLGLTQSGFRLVFNNGPDAGEAVPHLHCHIIGGRRMGWPPG